MPMTREAFTSTLGLGFHTAFRKATNAPQAPEIHRLINTLDNGAWDTVLEFVVQEFETTYGLTWAQPGGNDV